MINLWTQEWGWSDWRRLHSNLNDKEAKQLYLMEQAMYQDMHTQHLINNINAPAAGGTTATDRPPFLFEWGGDDPSVVGYNDLRLPIVFEDASPLFPAGNGYQNYITLDSGFQTGNAGFASIAGGGSFLDNFPRLRTQATVAGRDNCLTFDGFTELNSSPSAGRYISAFGMLVGGFYDGLTQFQGVLASNGIDVSPAGRESSIYMQVEYYANYPVPPGDLGIGQKLEVSGPKAVRSQLPRSTWTNEYLSVGATTTYNPGYTGTGVDNEITNAIYSNPSYTREFKVNQWVTTPLLKWSDTANITYGPSAFNYRHGFIGFTAFTGNPDGFFPVGFSFSISKLKLGYLDSFDPSTYTTIIEPFG